MESFASEHYLPFPFPKASVLPAKRKIYSNLESFLRVNLHYHLTLPELTVNQALIDLATRVREVSASFYKHDYFILPSYGRMLEI